MENLRSYFALAVSIGGLLAWVPPATAQVPDQMVLQLKELLRAETERILQTESCSTLADARPFVDAALVLAKRHQVLAGSRTQIQGTRNRLNQQSLAKGCTNGQAPGGGFTQVNIPVRGGGGGIKNRPVPNVVLATLYMSPAEQERFLATLSAEDRATVTEWTRQSSEDVGALRESINSSLLLKRRFEANDILRETLRQQNERPSLEREQRPLTRGGMNVGRP